MKHSSNSKAFPLRAIGALSAMFLLGAIGGGGTVVIVLKQSLQSAITSDETSLPATQAMGRIASLLKKELDLTPDEQEAVAEELQIFQDRIIDVRSGLLEEIRSEVNRSLDRAESRLPESKHQALREVVRQRMEPWGFYAADGEE